MNARVNFQVLLPGGANILGNAPTKLFLLILIKVIWLCFFLAGILLKGVSWGGGDVTEYPRNKIRELVGWHRLTLLNFVATWDSPSTL